MNRFENELFLLMSKNKKFHFFFYQTIKNMKTSANKQKTKKMKNEVY